jgi:hypothetical protein
MNNSFYYFYSAIPQVLSGVLALFGVFVIFKIQTIKSEILSIGQSIYENLVDSVGDHRMDMKDTEWIYDTKKLRNLIYISIECKDVKKLFNILYGADYKKAYSSISSDDLKEEIGKEYDFLRTLINETIKSFITTSVTIVACLIILPFGSSVLDHPVLLWALYSLIIVCVSYCFYKIIKILKQSIEE